PGRLFQYFGSMTGARDETTAEGISPQAAGGNRRVVVTGIGAISAAGIGVGALDERLRGASTCIREIRSFDTSELRVHVAGEADLPADIPALPRAARVRASRSDRLALVALAEALDSAGLGARLAGLDPTRVGVAIGSSTGGMRETESFYATLVRDVPARAWSTRLSAASVAAPADLVAAATGACGPRL